MTIENKTIVLGLLARDCWKSLLRNIPRVEAIGQAFKDYHVIIYENDSKDGTAEELQAWAERNPHVVAICETTSQTTIPQKSKRSPYPLKSVHRIERMARFRNRVLDEVRSRFTPDFFCFIDIDIERFSPQTVIDAICHAPADWGGLFASGHFLFEKPDGTELMPSFQYDAYAFVPEGIDPMQTGDWIISSHFHKVTAWYFNHLVHSHEYLPCQSAFNGIGIYRWEAISDLSYRVMQTSELQNVDACFCEHVALNTAVSRKGYKLYVAQRMEVIYYHKRLTLIRRFDHWLKSFQARRLLSQGRHPYGQNLL